MSRIAGAAIACCLLVVACGGADSSDLGSDDGLEAASTEENAVGSSSTVVAPPSTPPETEGAASTGTPAASTVRTTVPSSDTSAGSDEAQSATTAATLGSVTSASASIVESTAPPTTETATTQTTGAPPSVAPATAPPARVVDGQTWSPFARFEDVTLIQPSIRIERIGFHESNHDGARQLEPEPNAVNPMVLESRNRGTGSRTAADIVVEPGTEIRAPVTGTVLRAGGYILYCRHNDDFVVIEPDTHPGWEVKLLHISGVTVKAGDRVEAGVTVLAPTATQLPFDSQVDEFTAEPSWPHVHVELVDPSIPDRPSTGGGC